MAETTKDNSAPTPRERFNALWKALSESKEDTVYTSREDLSGVVLPTISGSELGTLRIKQEGHVTGSLRPRVRTIQLVEDSGEVTELDDVMVAFGSGSAEVLGSLATFEALLSPPDSTAPKAS